MLQVMLPTAVSMLADKPWHAAVIDYPRLGV